MIALEAITRTNDKAARNGGFVILKTAIPGQNPALHPGPPAKALPAQLALDLLCQPQCGVFHHVKDEIKAVAQPIVRVRHFIIIEMR